MVWRTSKYATLAPLLMAVVKHLFNNQAAIPCRRHLGATAILSKCSSSIISRRNVYAMIWPWPGCKTTLPSASWQAISLKKDFRCHGCLKEVFSMATMPSMCLSSKAAIDQADTLNPVCFLLRCRWPKKCFSSQMLRHWRPVLLSASRHVC